MTYKESALGKWKSDKFGENFVQEPDGDIIKFEIQCKFGIIGNFKIVLGRSFQIEDLQTATVFLWHEIGGTFAYWYSKVWLMSIGKCAKYHNVLNPISQKLLFWLDTVHIPVFTVYMCISVKHIHEIRDTYSALRTSNVCNTWAPVNPIIQSTSCAG